MTEKQISFSGVNLTPYADISPDGQLAVSAGLEMHVGSIRPSVIKGHTNKLPSSGYTLMHLHTTASYSHFIFLFGEHLYWSHSDEGGSLYPVIISSQLPGVRSVTSVGNTLVALTDNGMQYFLWKGGSYKYIGQKPPELDISFSLAGREDQRNNTELGLSVVSDVKMGSLISMYFEDGSEGTGKITPFANSMINVALGEAMESGYISCPCFVRYAYRTFDGSFTMLSAPVLLIPSSTGPRVFLLNPENHNGYLNFTASTVHVPKMKIMYRIDHISDALQQWSDIISGIEIFITPQFYPFDNGESVRRIFRTNEGPEGFGVYAYVPGTIRESIEDQSISDISFQLHAHDYSDSGETVFYLEMPLKDATEFKEELVGGMQFYKCDSLSLESVVSSTVWKTLSTDKKTLNNIVLKESLDDSYDYQSHDTLIPSGSFIYNQRINLYGLSRLLFSGFPYKSMSQFCYASAYATTEVYVYLKCGDGKNRVVKCATDHSYTIGTHFFYYPDPNAYRMVIVFNNIASADVPLTPHPLLNGAYWLCWGTDSFPLGSSHSIIENNPPIEISNKVYTSEVGNPYIFPLNGICTVGTGEIYGVSSVATALSQGQFGQFPLIVFCSDGNYALSVDSEGYYSTVSPIQRDVCINPGSITQMDREVLFVSSRGVMITEGSSVHCISSALDGVPEHLPEDVTTDVFVPSSPPSDFMKSTLVAYDYANQRILFMSRTENMSYVYSIRDGAWSTAVFGTVTTIINVYPYSYLQFDTGEIMRLEDTYSYNDDADYKKGAFYTRPLKLDTYQLKRIHQFSLQGLFTEKQKLYLYGSQDGDIWFLIGSTTRKRVGAVKGRFFKYYRIAVVTSLKTGENISGLRIVHEVNTENRIR